MVFVASFAKKNIIIHAQSFLHKVSESANNISKQTIKVCALLLAVCVQQQIVQYVLCPCLKKHLNYVNGIDHDVTEMYIINIKV